MTLFAAIIRGNSVPEIPPRPRNESGMNAHNFNRGTAINQPAPHGNLGYVLEEEGKLAEAVAEFQRAIQLDPKMAPAHNDLGHVLEKQGKPKEAAVEFTRAHELQPNRF